MPVAQVDAVWATSQHPALSLGCPVVERADGHIVISMDLFGREHPTTVGQRFRHWDSLRLEGDGADGVHTSLSGITQLQAAIHIALSIIFGLRSTNRST